ncbi:MAG: CHRD domain-containing protein [Pedobacter sp.]
MIQSWIKGVVRLCLAILLLFLGACKKESSAESAKVKPPVRIYVVTARADKKGTNSSSAGTAVLKGQYDEETKVLSYSIEYTDIEPQVMTLRYGPKGSAGTFVKELYNINRGKLSVINGGFELTPLQERNLLKGLWFVAVNTAIMTPEISGVLTYKQQ